MDSYIFCHIYKENLVELLIKMLSLLNYLLTCFLDSQINLIHRVSRHIVRKFDQSPVNLVYVSYLTF